MLIGYDPYGGTMQHFDRGGIIAEVAAAGYDAINLPMRPDFMDVDDEADLRVLQDMLVSNGLKTPSIGVAPHTWATPGKEAATQECLAAAIRAAGRFGAQLLTMWPHLPPGVDKEDALAVLRRNMEAGVPKADAVGYPIAFEFEKGCTIDNYREGIEFVEATDGRIRVVADTYHIFNDGADPYAAAVALGGLLGEVHISASDRGEPGSPADEFDYGAFVRGLREIGFDGPVMLQYRLEDPASVGRACAFTRRLFDV